jgi:4-hydroxybenzoate polyprenyltransferase
MPSAQPFRLAPLLHLMRIPHWLKNGLVLAPLLFSRSFHDDALVQAAALATLSFCLLASAIYVWNDLRDAEADRRHQQKQRRPLAAGTVSRQTAVGLAAVLAVLSLLLLLLVPQALPFAAGYAAINVLYSAWLKHWPWMDLLLLTAGYVIRVFAGAAVIDVEPTPWMLSATFFLALYLATLKRFAERNLYGMEARASLKGYTQASLRAVALGAGAAAIGCYALFTLLVRPQLLFTLPPAVAGVLRYGWLVLHRNGGDSPFRLVWEDRWLVATLCLWLLGIVAGLW